MTNATETQQLLERLRQAAELLELIAVDRHVLGHVPAEDRERLFRALSLVQNPSSRTRRRMLKAAAREERATRVKKDQGRLDRTGIRALRRKPVVNTPNFFPPRFPGGRFEPHDLRDAGDQPSRETSSIDPRHC